MPDQVQAMTAASRSIQCVIALNFVTPVCVTTILGITDGKKWSNQQIPQQISMLRVYNGF